MSEILRTCCVCRKKQDKKNMIRITLQDKILYVDNQKQHTGKGCYVCNSEECKKNIIAKKVLNRVYKYNIEQEQYNKLCEELKIAKNNDSKN